MIIAQLIFVIALVIAVYFFWKNVRKIIRNIKLGRDYPVEGMRHSDGKFYCVLPSASRRW